MQPKIYFASDHAGFALKNELVAFVRDTLGFEVVDCGADEYNELDDFTDFIAKASREVSANPSGANAIILGGSGQGEAMLANRFHAVRAAVYYGGDEEIIRLSRLHNDANVLSLGARFLQSDEAKNAVALWLQTKHVPLPKYDHRVDEIEKQSGSNTFVGLPTKLPMSLAPSLPAQSLSQLSSFLDTLKGVAPSIQIDIVDGVFAPYVSWPFTELDIEESLKILSSYPDFEIEMDCMCMNPEDYLDVFVGLHIKRVIIHAGSTSRIAECIKHAKEHGYKIGLGLLNTTPSQLLATYAGQIDFVQVMGIEHIGVQGQPFDEKTLGTISFIRKTYPNLEIAVDGAVNATTIPALLQAGANRFAPGSAIAQAQDPVSSYKQLCALIGI